MFPDRDIYSNYTNYIKSFINTDINSWHFKSNELYTGILEHVTYQQGMEYLDTIKDKFKSFYDEHKYDLVQLCKKNDLYGSTIKFDYSDFIECSPSNLRYILHSLIILTYMKECNLETVDIIEIGGGYGGLCLFLYEISKLFNVKINSYSMFDLPEVKLLQKKYLETLNITNVNYESTDNIQNLRPNSFLISNYALTEINENLRRDYIENVLKPYTSHGFICWNTFSPYNYNFIDNKDITIIYEYPDFNKKTANSDNYYVFYKPLKNSGF